jgi:predicted RNA-binding protein with PIN domain
VPYLIDGNNLLGSWGGPRGRGDAREQVVRRVVALCRGLGARAVLVFDGAPLRADFPEQELGGVRLRFPRPGEDADGVIRGLVDAAARPAEWTVVTSDKALYSYCRTRGAAVLRAHEWNRLERRPSAAPARPAPSPNGEKPARETDVEGWLKRFGHRDPAED